MTQKLDGIVSAVRGLKSQGVRELRAILTPSNLKVMLESYVPDLFGWNMRVITVDGFGDDEWLQHSVVVASNIEMDRRQLKPLSDLIGTVYPHHITEHLAPEELGPHYDGESNYVQFAAVTRAYAKRWQEKAIGLAGIAGTDGQSVTEDDVRRIDDFLDYGGESFGLTPLKPPVSPATSGLLVAGRLAPNPTNRPNSGRQKGGYRGGSGEARPPMFWSTVCVMTFTTRGRSR